MPNVGDTDEVMRDEPVVISQPQPEQAVDANRLQRAFEWQQKQITQIIGHELDKRVPPFSATSASSSGSKQAASFWSSLLTSPEHKSNAKDEHMIEKLLAKNNDLQQKITGLESLLADLRKDKSAQNTQHASDLGKLQKELSSASADCYALKVEHASLKGDHDNTRRELAKEKAKRAELEDKTAHLRSMLIPAKETQLSDHQVIQMFTGLRNQILKLVKTAWSRDTKDDFVASEEQVGILKPFYTDAVSVRYLDNRLRGVVFDFLDDYIFGVLHYDIDPKHSSLENKLGQTESYMWRKLPKEGHASIIDWRLATMNATAPFRSDGKSLADAAYVAIDEFFQIFQPLEAKAHHDGKELLKKICKDAVALSLLMRTAKDEYRIEVLSGSVDKPYADYEGRAEEEAYHPASSESQKTDTIAYIMTGALVKRPYDNVTDIKVLEKAQAIVYTRPEKKK